MSPVASRKTWTLVLASLAVFMTALDTLVVTTALPVLRIDLHAGLAGLEWTVNAYNLAFACLLLTGAALGDRPVGRHHRARRRRRAGRRRRRGRRDRLALDLLAQRPDRPRADPGRARAPEREPRSARGARPARAAARGRRGAGAH